MGHQGDIPHFLLTSSGIPAAGPAGPAGPAGTPSTGSTGSRCTSLTGAPASTFKRKEYIACETMSSRKVPGWIKLINYASIWFCSLYMYIQYVDNFVYGLSQWETTLHCNVASHWLSPYTKWPLQYILWNMHTVFLCFVLIWFYIRS